MRSSIISLIIYERWLKKHVQFRKFSSIWRFHIQVVTCVGCPLVEPGPIGWVPILEVPLRNPSPYLREFRRKLRTARWTSATGNWTWHFPHFPSSAELLRHWWGGHLCNIWAWSRHFVFIFCLIKHVHASENLNQGEKLSNNAISLIEMSVWVIANCWLTN